MTVTFTIPSASSTPSTGPLVLETGDLAAMPRPLHDALQAWVVQHRAAQAHLPWHERVLPPTEAALHELAMVFVRVVADLAPVSTLDTWLRTYQGQRYTLAGPVQHPIDLVVAAVSSRRLDVLTTVLDVPAFCPVERERARYITVDGPTPEHAALVKRHGKAWFNGGVAQAKNAAVHTQGWGHALTALIKDHQRTPLVGTDDPLHAWVLDQDPVVQAWERRFKQFPMAEPSGVHRAHPHVNLVGMATMMGWTDGVRVLLDHGVDPYARHSEGTSQAQFMSPVMLAAHYNEAAVLIDLLQHPTFDPMHRFGYTASQWARLELQPTRDGLLWDNTIEEPGGFDVRWVLERPHLMDVLPVRDALAHAFQRMKPGQRQRLASGLPPMAAQAWERVVLHHTVQQAWGTGESQQDLDPADEPGGMARLARFRARL